MATRNLSHWSVDENMNYQSMLQNNVDEQTAFDLVEGMAQTRLGNNGGSNSAGGSNGSTKGKGGGVAMPTDPTLLQPQVFVGFISDQARSEEAVAKMLKEAGFTAAQIEDIVGQYDGEAVLTELATTNLQDHSDVEKIDWSELAQLTNGSFVDLATAVKNGWTHYTLDYNGNPVRMFEGKDPDSTVGQMDVDMDQAYREQYTSTTTSSHNSHTSGGKKGPPAGAKKTSDPNELPKFTFDNKPDVYVAVSGDERVWTVSNLSLYELERLAPHIDFVYDPTEGQKGELLITLPKEAAKFEVRAKSNVLCCAFDATQEFISNNLGKKMAESDKNWYKAHPRTTQAGLPQDVTLTVLQDLVAPYNLGVSRVWMPKNVSAFEETKPWQEALGINPKAAVDRDTSNWEFALLMAGGDEAAAAEMYPEINEKYRFEYVDYLPEVPRVAMVGSSGTSWASGMGHASYYGPRQDVAGWKIALQYDNLRDIEYYAKPPSLGYEAVKETVLNFWQSKANNGQTIQQASSYSGGHSSGGYSGGSSLGSGGGLGSNQGYRGTPQGKSQPTTNSTSTSRGGNPGATTRSASSEEGRPTKQQLVNDPKWKEFDEFCMRLTSKHSHAIARYELDLEEEMVRTILERVAKLETSAETNVFDMVGDHPTVRKALLELSKTDKDRALKLVQAWKKAFEDLSNGRVTIMELYSLYKSLLARKSREASHNKLIADWMMGILF